MNEQLVMSVVNWHLTIKASKVYKKNLGNILYMLQ